MAMTIVEQSGGQYHVLLIIADGQVRIICPRLILHAIILCFLADNAKVGYLVAEARPNDRMHTL